MADVPVSLFLSGGVDSSAIASSASGASSERDESRYWLR